MSICPADCWDLQTTLEGLEASTTIGLLTNGYHFMYVGPEVLHTDLSHILLSYLCFLLRVLWLVYPVLKLLNFHTL